MTNYRTRATRWAKGWELHVHGVGVTQSRTLATAADEARDYIVSQTGTPESDVHVILETDLGELGQRIIAMRNMRRHAEAEQIKAGHESRRIARELRQQGFSVTDIAAVLEVSRGRVSQLVATTSSERS